MRFVFGWLLGSRHLLLRLPVFDGKSTTKLTEQRNFLWAILRLSLKI